MTFRLEHAESAASQHNGCMHCGGTALASYLEEACAYIRELENLVATLRMTLESVQKHIT